MTNYWTDYITFFNEFFIATCLNFIIFNLITNEIIKLDFEKIMNIDYFHSYTTQNRKSIY